MLFAPIALCLELRKRVAQLALGFRQAVLVAPVQARLEVGHKMRVTLVAIGLAEPVLLAQLYLSRDGFVGLVI